MRGTTANQTPKCYVGCRPLFFHLEKCLLHLAAIYSRRTAPDRLSPLILFRQTGVKIPLEPYFAEPEHCSAPGLSLTNGHLAGSLGWNIGTLKQDTGKLIM